MAKVKSGQHNTMEEQKWRDWHYPISIVTCKVTEINTAWQDNRNR